MPLLLRFYGVNGRQYLSLNFLVAEERYEFVESVTILLDILSKEKPQHSLRVFRYLFRILASILAAIAPSGRRHSRSTAKPLI